MNRKLLFSLLLAAALVCPAALCAQAPRPQWEPVPNFEFYGGYSYVFNQFGTMPGNVGTHGMNGWDTSLKVPVLAPWLGIKGDVSGNYNSSNEPNFNPRSYFFLLGPQVSVHLGRSTVFAHGMIGSAHVSQNALPNLRSGNAFAVAVGGGLDAGFSRHLAWRVTGDYYDTHYKSTDQNLEEILNSNGRISTGPILRF